MIYDGDIPDNTEIFTNCERDFESNETLLLLFQDISRIHNDKFANKILCFYTYDDYFDIVWKETAKIAEKIKEKSFKTVITPNWSMFTDDPLALQIWNTFKSRYVGRYLQKIGLKIIPDVNFSDEKSFEFCFDGLPQHCQWISLQSQNVSPNDKQAVKNFFDGLNEIKKRINFDCLLVYGKKFENEIKTIFPQQKIVFVETWANKKINKQRKERT